VLPHTPESTSGGRYTGPAAAAGLDGGAADALSVATTLSTSPAEPPLVHAVNTPQQMTPTNTNALACSPNLMCPPLVETPLPGSLHR
jgi:hypothetical protein